MGSFGTLDAVITFASSYLPGLALLSMIIMGIFTAKLAHKKGYRGYFFTGFFFNLIVDLRRWTSNGGRLCGSCEARGRIEDAGGSAAADQAVKRRKHG